MDRSPVLHGWAICSAHDLRNSIRVSNVILHIIKPMDLLYFVFQFYLNLKLATIVRIFFNSM